LSDERRATIIDPGISRIPHPTSHISKGGLRVRNQIAIYVHFPFCRQKCYYCDFNSYSELDHLIPEYLTALHTEIESYLPQTRPVGSIYFGGGTPTYLPAEMLTETLRFLKRRLYILPRSEITIEVNPGTVTPDKLIDLKAAGFNRLSIGLQATRNELLESIGRIHTWGDFGFCYQLAREVGFDNIGVDLIFGLPRQTLSQWRETLEQVVAIGPEHISTYGLQLESGTLLKGMVERGETELPEEDEVAAMMELAMSYLPGNGYRHYEISNYAKPGRESVHNLSYWECRDYLGFGAGAYSTVYGERWSNFKDPRLYIDRIQNRLSIIAERELLGERTKAVEALMLGLRTRKGINLQAYRERHRIDLTRKARVELANLSDEQLVVHRDDSLFLTDKGILISNYVISRLLRVF
jgi:oxygen-independent coproporphyrinogen-3 oxidase